MMYSRNFQTPDGLSMPSFLRPAAPSAASGADPFAPPPDSPLSGTRIPEGYSGTALRAAAYQPQPRTAAAAYPAQTPEQVPATPQAPAAQTPPAPSRESAEPARHSPSVSGQSAEQPSPCPLLSPLTESDTRLMELLLCLIRGEHRSLRALCAALLLSDYL